MSARRTLLSAAVIAAVAAGGWFAWTQLRPQPHNVILFVADGLRYGSVTPETAPAMAALKAEGVDFADSHSMYPTLTTVNASAFATGHGIGDTGDFANTVFVGSPPLPSANPGRVPFYEDDAILGDMNQRYAPSYLDETTVLEAARKAGYQTAAIGKIGPVAIQDVTARDGEGTIVIDDATGYPSAGGLPLAPDVARAMTAAGLAPQAPDRGLNTDPGSYNRAGVIRANVEQQDWFAAVATQVLLPRFKTAGKPFVMVFWSRDPDGTQHNEGDSLNQLTPGINGPTSLEAVRNADDDLARLRAALAAQGLDKTTDIVVVADHGFTTISRQSATSPAAKSKYLDVVPGFLPPGFLAIDLAKALDLGLSDSYGLPVRLEDGFHPRDGSALLGDPADPEAVVAANGGSDLIWLPKADARALAPRIVKALLAQDYTAAVFVDERLGAIPGTLPTSAVGLQGAAITPKPAIVVSFKSFGTGCADAQMCAAEVADTTLQQGQGMHGSLSRAETHNFMAATGPDFKAGFRDTAPVSNADIGAIFRPSARVAVEALAGGPAPGAATVRDVASAPGDGGFVTVLHEQVLDGHVYYDWAGAEGRVVTGRP
jgi:hypothetical protein